MQNILDNFKAGIEAGLEKANKSSLLPCACGAIPEFLIIADAGQCGKWAKVSAGCCGVWEMEFCTRYEPLDSEKCMQHAIEAWNDAPRVKDV